MTQYSSEELRKLRLKGYLDNFKKTPITSIAGIILLCLGYPSTKFLGWINKWCKCLKEHAIVELYVFVFLILEVIIFWRIGTINPGLVPLWSSIILSLLLGYRLVDIFQSWINIFVSQPSTGILYPARSLLFGIINYIELILSFSILGYAWNISINPRLHNIADSALFTIGTMTAIGSNSVPVSVWAWIIYLAEIGFGLFFLIVIITRILSHIKNTYK
jgi:hypothetical protein